MKKTFHVGLGARIFRDLNKRGLRESGGGRSWHGQIPGMSQGSFWVCHFTGGSCCQAAGEPSGVFLANHQTYDGCKTWI